MFNTVKLGKLVMAQCPECKHWYERNTMVVVNYGQPNKLEVCADCYEDKYFIPPEPLGKEETNV